MRCSRRPGTRPSAIRHAAATTLIAGDLMDPAAPRDIWDTALDELGGEIDVLVNNAGIYEGVADNVSDEEWHAAWHRTMTINLQSAADLSRLAVSHFLDRGGARTDRADRQCREPRGVSRRLAAALALCGVEGGAGRDDEDHRARLCGRRDPVLRGRAGLHRVGDDRRISSGARRGADRRRHPARTCRKHRRNRRSDPLAMRSTRRPRRPAASSTRTGQAMFVSLFLAAAAQILPIVIPFGKPQPLEKPRAPIETSGPLFASQCTESDDYDKPAPPVRIFGNTYIVGTCGITSILITDPAGDILIDGGTGRGRRPHRCQCPQARLPADRHPIHSAQPRALRSRRRNREAAAADRSAAHRLSGRRGGPQQRDSGEGRSAGGNPEAIPGGACRSRGAGRRNGPPWQQRADRHRDPRPYRRRADLALGQLPRRGMPVRSSMPTA